MPRRRTILLVLLVLSSGLGACSRSSPAPPTDDGPPVVYVVNYPLQYFAERIGGDHVDVRFPAPGDIDPAFWRPSAAVIAQYQSADLILRNGADYAKWTAMASLPAARTADTSASFRDRYVHTEEGVTHSHGPGGEHSHAGTAFTTWLDFEQAAQQARAVHAALVALRPENAALFDANLQSLESDLTGLDARMQAIAENLGDAPLVSSHPVYQYWARRYGLNERALVWEPEQVPDEAALRELDDMLANHPARLMIWEGDPVEATKQLLTERGLRIVVFAPCGNEPPESDFADAMRANLERLEAILQTDD